MFLKQVFRVCLELFPLISEHLWVFHRIDILHPNQFYVVDQLIHVVAWSHLRLSLHNIGGSPASPLDLEWWVWDLPEQVPLQLHTILHPSRGWETETESETERDKEAERKRQRDVVRYLLVISLITLNVK